jgi:hypothetical protein
MAATQNTLVVIDDTTIATNIKPAYIAELMQCSKVTGKPLSRLLNEAIYEFMTLQGSIYMNDAGHDAPYRPQPKQHQKV